MKKGYANLYGEKKEMIIDMGDPNTIPKSYREAGKGLLADLQAKKITMDEFEYETGLMSLHCGWEQYRNKPEPSPPLALMEYRRMNDKEKRGVTLDFWKRDDIKTYLEERQKIKAHNYMVRHWLNYLIKVFEKYGAAKACLAKVRKRMEEEKIAEGDVAWVGQ